MVPLHRPTAPDSSRQARAVGLPLPHSLTLHLHPYFVCSAGVKRIASGVFSTEAGMRGALRAWLEPVVKKAVTLAEHGRRHTVIVSDVAYSLKSMGRTLYGYDWSYASVRERIARPMRPEALARAAARRAAAAAAKAAAAAAPAGKPQQQQAAAAGTLVPTPEGRAQLPAAPAATESMAAAGTAQPVPSCPAPSASQQPQPSNQENVPPPSALGAAAPSGSLAVGDSFHVASVIGEQGGDGEVAQPTPAAAANAGAAAGSLLSPLGSVLAERTPPAPLVLSRERALEIQTAMSDLIHRHLARRGSVSRRELFTALPQRLPCQEWEMEGTGARDGWRGYVTRRDCAVAAAAALRWGLRLDLALTASCCVPTADVLYTLEHELEAIMTEGDEIFMCS